MSGRPCNSVWIDLTLIHVDQDPAAFTAAMELIPRHAGRAGSKVGQIVRNKTVWIANLYEGRPAEDDFSDALERVISVLKSKSTFLNEFTGSGGEALLTLNHSIDYDEGLLADLRLEPLFLGELGRHSVALQVRGWSDDNWPAVTSD